MRFVQLTPPGSGCSISFGTGLGEDMAPGSAQGLQLVVDDIEAAHADLSGRGVEVERHRATSRGATSCSSATPTATAGPCSRSRPAPRPASPAARPRAARSTCAGSASALVSSSSTWSSPAMKANATWPSLEPSATTTVRPARAISAAVGGGLDLVLRREPARGVDAVDADEREVDVDALQRRVGERADELVGRAARDAAGDDQLEVRAHRELDRDVERVGDHGEVAARGEHARHLGRRGAAGEPDRRPVLDELGGRAGDPLLLVAAARAVADRQLVRGAVGDRAAVRALEQALLAEQLEVAADGGLADPEVDARARRRRPTRRARAARGCGRSDRFCSRSVHHIRAA